MNIQVTRNPHILKPDPSRLLLRQFDMSGPDQARHVVSRVLAIPEEEVADLVASMLTEFGGRRTNLHHTLLERFAQIWPLIPTDQPLSEPRKLLIGSYFYAEYAVESAALFNPSIVPHPDQSDFPPDCLRILLSLRATGEGHISSITFRSGVVDGTGTITIDPPNPNVVEPEIIPNPLYQKPLFRRKLFELGLYDDFTRNAIERLDERFTLVELKETLDNLRSHRRASAQEGASDAFSEAKVLSLAMSNYEAKFDDSLTLSQRIIFPYTPSQRNGIEDARFVQFNDEEGPRYYATYTAYDGRLVLPQMITTEDFQHFRFSTLNGPAVKNKGMALFPRKIRGHYAMLSRQDGENIQLMYSDNPHFWYRSEVIARPRFPWELVQLGNCGSPIETRAGWLVLSHGVGPMRKYCLGAFLLDLDRPDKVLGRLPQPLLMPMEEERTGYLPNVVYTCGALVHGGRLILPYAISDYATRFAHIELAQILDAMR